MESGAASSMITTPNFAAFDTFAKAVNCTQPPGAERLACLKSVPASTISAWLNGPTGLTFGSPVVDKYVEFRLSLSKFILINEVSRYLLTHINASKRRKLLEFLF